MTFTIKSSHVCREDYANYPTKFTITAVHQHYQKLYFQAQEWSLNTKLDLAVYQLTKITSTSVPDTNTYNTNVLVRTHKKN